ncbi:MAG: hypothetical protein WCC61_17945 [Pseudomonas sp.]|uniref:hypothetical protein n=1 Tax=Pseudomonas sp. TaxID=306 RepID=UPI001242F10F|nr:hypothetical protein PS681_02792 [Pseudomonas fluorescens]VVN58505.1 hypothetical protein PS684_03203 [Pseudomonas fluorescens]
MTAEIAIMSRTAVVLAADSATTVTSWKDGLQERRYFKGANKLFELSRSAPVGLMIYGSASLQGVPWELAIKSFREDLGEEQHDRLEAYPKRFFDFIEHHEKLFSEQARNQALFNLIGSAAYRMQKMVSDQHELDSLAGLSTLSTAQVDQALDIIEATVDEMPLHALITDVDIANAIAKSSTSFIEAAPESLIIFQNQPDRASLVPKFVNTLIKYAVKDFINFSDRTGVVIAGYGKDDYYPSLEVFECYGFLGDRLIFSRQDPRNMDAESPAVIQPFATTSMIDTFRMGVAPDVFGAVFDSTSLALADFGRKVMEECGTPDAVQSERLAELVKEARDGHTDKWFHKIRNQHFFPLSNIIHSLPLPDMAGLAKSLIELESLKERVTKPSESVSGPIDVAIISKHDGFVWIDRKHYFKPELNPRFFKRS